MLNWVIFLVYPTICNAIFTTFKCIDGGHGKTYLRADMNRQCSPVGEDAEYTSMLIKATIGAIVYVLGVPVLYGIILFRKRRFLMSPKEAITKTKGELGIYDVSSITHYKARQRFSQLFIQYEHEYWYSTVTPLCSVSNCHVTFCN